MPFVPRYWNVVALGRWNRSILTPQGIAARLFEVPAGTQIDVQFPVDAIGPPLVSHDGLTVIASSQQLFVQPEACNYEELKKAMVIAHRAMANLPETPISAVGFNLRFHSENLAAPVASIADALIHPWDKLLYKEHTLQRREWTRRMEWKNGGTIQIDFVLSLPGALDLAVNFERKAKEINGAERAALLNWLSMPMEDVLDKVEHLLFATLPLTPEMFQK